MKAITEWEELKGKTIVDVLAEDFVSRILVFKDDTFCCVHADCEGLCGVPELTWYLDEAKEAVRRWQEGIEQKIREQEARDIAEYARLKAKFEGRQGEL